MASVSIEQVSKFYAGTKALDEISLELTSGEFVTLLGPSGCGKSTTLRAVAGLVEIDRGSIAIDRRNVTGLPTNRRNIGMVFQNLALFPHMTVAENVAFGLRMRRVPAAERAEKSLRALAMVQLSGFEDRYPHQLSGGQQQRVAIARALVINPSVLLLDEPFAALDRKLREEMQIELRELTRRVGITSIFVTHDQEEALTLSDRIAVMNGGRIEQVGVPDEVYSQPETEFVADFMGIQNILEAEIVIHDQAMTSVIWHGMTIELPAIHDRHLIVGKRTKVAIRPELIKVSSPTKNPSRPNMASGHVISRVDQGLFATLRVQIDGEEDATLTVRQTKSDEVDSGRFTPNERIELRWRGKDAIMLRDTPRGEKRRSQTKPPMTSEHHSHSAMQGIQRHADLGI